MTRLDSVSVRFVVFNVIFSFFHLDCPQFIAVSSYSSTERDELDIKEGDLMNVIVELSDGK